MQKSILIIGGLVALIMFGSICVYFIRSKKNTESAGEDFEILED